MAKDPKEIVRRIRVGGRVADLPIDYATEPTLRLSFRIMDPGKSEPSTIENTIAVVYEGLRPDMFAAGRDVIIDGHFEGGILYAATLLTQCPSKYEPPDAPKSE
jgi:cytochrome c-type biogenesis protein CcmE